MTDCVRTQGGEAAEIWPNTSKSQLVFTPELMATIVEVQSGSVAVGDAWDGAAFSRPAISKADLDAYASAARFAKECAGLTINGVSLATDRAAQSMMTGAVVYAQVNPSSSVKWKTAGGFVTLTAAQVIAIGQRVATYVEDCFSKEAELVSSIEAGTITTTAEIDSAFASVQ